MDSPILPKGRDHDRSRSRDYLAGRADCTGAIGIAGFCMGGTFAQADITSFGGYNGRLNTIVDSDLFHAQPQESRQNYIQCIRQAAGPGRVTIHPRVRHGISSEQRRARSRGIHRK